MTFSRVLASLTGRQAEPSPAARRPASHDSSPAVAAALLKSDHLQLVPAATGEHSLGSAREVRERIAEILPGVTFDEHGRGTFARTGYSVTFDTGADDYVRSVVLEITGRPAAVPSIARIIAKTGWRLAPRDPQTP
jgi:hypothetical protein